MNRAKAIALNAVLCALALTSFMLENLIPSVVPGVRIGLSNVFVFAACLLLSPLEAFVTLLVKCVGGAIFSGNLYSLVYSLPSGALSLSVACVIFYCSKSISLTACGSLCAVINSAAQTLIFALTSQTARVLIYAPIILSLSAAFGAITGALCLTAIKRTPIARLTA